MQWSGHKAAGPAQDLATIRTQEWRGHPYALDLRGRPRKLEPLPNI